MKQDEFVKLIQGALLVFDGDTDADLLLRKGYTLQDIKKSKQVKTFVEGLK